MSFAFREKQITDAAVGAVASPSLAGALPSAGVLTLAWPLERLPEAYTELSRRAGFKPVTADNTEIPTSIGLGDQYELDRWMGWMGERLGLEVEPVETMASGMVAMLQGAGPAILQLHNAGSPLFMLLLAANGGKLRVIGPDLRIRTCDAEELAELVLARHEAPLNREIDRVLQVAGLPPGRWQQVRPVIARARLGNKKIGGMWLLRLPPTASFSRQIIAARLPLMLLGLLALFGTTYGLEIAGWSVMGQTALSGRIDFGWLAAWALIILSVVPLRYAGGRINARLAVEMSRLLKSRLLVGALRIDTQALRQQGAGQMLARVMESQAFEALAVNGGLASLIAVVELGMASWVLSLGAGGMLHVALLGLWLALAGGLGWRYYRCLDRWTDLRMDLTHGLVERMIGHRTTLAQELPARRDQVNDTAMKNYLTASGGLDAAVMPFLAGLPAGWVIAGLAGLAPAFIAQTATPESLAIGLGGVLFAGRAIGGICGGVAGASRAAIAWRQIAPLFRAGAATPSQVPFIPAEEMQFGATGVGPGSGAKLIDAEGLSYRYHAGGENILRDASLTIHHGERLLLEGQSGGGKSTLASLLTGLRQPDSGLLLLNGLDRHTMGDTWHQLATEAPQFHENHIMTGPLAYNLLMGRNWPATDEDLAEARAVCDDLGLGDLIGRMPAGLMQMVGETGWQLSHGERSRIFLARALLQNAQLTILDESFAALDPETLRRCLDSVFRRARTLMVIAHP